MQDSSWIFLRGLSREKLHWGEFPDFFEKYFNSKVHCLDFPGTGEFFKHASPSRIQEIVEHLVMHSSQITSQNWILAHSMGGLVALEWMKREPHRFLGAVLINSSVKGISPLFGRLTPFAIKQILNLWIHQKNPLKTETIKYALTSNDILKKQATIPRWMEIQFKHPVSIRTSWNQICAAAFYVASKPRYPTLLLNSTADRMVSPISSEAISRKWNLPLYSHSWAGHDLVHDDPVWVVHQIDEWKKSIEKK